MTETTSPKPRKPIHRRILRWSVLFFLWILLPLLAAETVFRVRHRLQDKPDDYMLTMTSENRQRRYQYRPGFSGVSHGNHNVRINSLGFRGREYPETKGPNTRRILILGDSVAFGLYRDEQYIFASLLEDYLNQESDQWKYEVFNSAVCGYNTENQLGTLRQMGPRIDPDLVILQTCINDFAPSNYVSAVQGGSYFNYRGDYLPEEGLGRNIGEHLEEHSVLFAEIVVNVDRYLKEKGRREDYFYYYKSYYREIFLGKFENPKVEQAWNDVLETTSRIQEETSEMGACFLCTVFLPSTLMKYEDRPGGYTSRLTRLAEEHGSNAIVMKDEFLPRWKDRSIFIDRVHLNGWGHELTARIIRDHLVEHPELFSGPRL